MNVASLQHVIQVRVFEHSCRRRGSTNHFVYLPIIVPLLAFLGVYKSYHLQLPGACLILLMGSVFILQFNFEFLMINYQEYTSENMRVSWIIAYYFLALDPSIAPLHFIQVCPGTPRTSWELSRNIYLLMNVWESPRSTLELPGALRYQPNFWSVLQSSRAKVFFLMEAVVRAKVCL